MKTYVTQNPPFLFLMVTIQDWQNIEEHITETFIASLAGFSRNDYEAIDIITLENKVVVYIWQVDNEVYAKRDFQLEFVREA